MTKQAPGSIILLGRKNALGAFTPWAGQVAFTLTQEKELAENGDKSNKHAKNLVVGFSWSASMDALYRTGDDGFASLNQAYTSEDVIDVEIPYPDGSKKVGQAHVVGMDENWAKGGNDPISISLTGEGELVFVPAPVVPEA